LRDLGRRDRQALASYDSHPRRQSAARTSWSGVCSID
jgi:hypothetical protein